MKSNPNSTANTQNKSISWTNPHHQRSTLNGPKKIFPPQSATIQHPFLTTNSCIKDYTNVYPNMLDEVTQSEVFISVPQPASHQKTGKLSSTGNKYIVGNSNNREKFKKEAESTPKALAKRSVQILIDLNQGMVKTQYSKISRRKEQFLRKNTVSSSEMVVKLAQKLENAHSEQKIIDKYRQLLQIKEKPFNMVNRLYQIELLTAKEAVIAPKEVFKATATRFNCKSINSQPNEKFIDSGKAQDIHLCESQKFITSQTDKSATLSSFTTTPKPYSQERYKQSRALRQIRSKHFKFNQQHGNQPISSLLNQRKLNQDGPKGQAQNISLESAAKNQKLAGKPLPKKISSAAFIIYEVLQAKNRSYSKKVEWQVGKKRQISGKIHAALNSKSSSEIASLTKIMTCIVIIEIGQKLAINLQSEKYKTGLYQSSIRGTTADIQPGQIYTIHQLLHGLMLPSGNDASVALARWGGNVLLLTDSQGQKRRVQQQGQKTLIDQPWLANNKYLRYKEDKLKFRRCYNRFLAEMNKKARVLGLQRTNYVNSHGLSNPHNKSCCLDLAILCEYAMQNSYFRAIVGCKQYSGVIERCVQSSRTDSPRTRRGNNTTKAELSEDPEQMNLLQDAQDDTEYNKSDEQDEDQTEVDLQVSSSKKQVKQPPQESLLQKQIKWVNTHRLLHKKECYLGIKTGVTATAGACLASFVSIKDRSFVIIVLNSKKLSLRFADTQLLRRWLVKKEGLGESVANMEYPSETNLNNE